jgi:hypothetical protein
MSHQDLRFFRLPLLFVSMATVIHIAALNANPQTTPSTNSESASLQVWNGSSQSITVYMENDDGSRQRSAVIPSGANQVIKTSIGNNHILIDAQGTEVARTSCRLPVQAFRYDRPGQFDLAENTHRFANDEVLPITSEMNVPDYYTRIIFASGYPIVASDSVDDYALREAAYLVNQLLAHRSDVREAMIASGSRLCIMSENEFTTDLPEFRWLAERSPKPGLTGSEYWDVRARGLGGSETDPYCSCGEENLLGFEGDPYKTENILIHEFAHNIHLRGMTNIDSTFDQRLRDTFNQAIKAGLWNGKYAATNHHEYFAEGVQSWFDNNRENDHDHNHVNTRAELIEYDPGLAKLCEEVFGDTVFHYTKPNTRLQDHMTGYDPSDAPTFRWPTRLQHAQTKLRD